MKEICIIPCGSKKIWDKYPKAGPKAAKDVYIGPFAKKCKEYAEKYYPKSWCVLSAKYGFLFPKDIVQGKYNVSFNDKKSGPISTDALLKQVKRRRLKRFDRFVILGGKNYVNIIKSNQLYLNRFG